MNADNNTNLCKWQAIFLRPNERIKRSLDLTGIARDMASLPPTLFEFHGMSYTLPRTTIAALKGRYDMSHLPPDESSNWEEDEETTVQVGAVNPPPHMILDEIDAEVQGNNDEDINEDEDVEERPRDKAKEIWGVLKSIQVSLDLIKY